MGFQQLLLLMLFWNSVNEKCRKNNRQKKPKIKIKNNLRPFPLRKRSWMRKKVSTLMNLRQMYEGNGTTRRRKRYLRRVKKAMIKRKIKSFLKCINSIRTFIHDIRFILMYSSFFVLWFFADVVAGIHFYKSISAVNTKKRMKKNSWTHTGRKKYINHLKSFIMNVLNKA